MATQYPNSLDVLNNPSSTDRLDSPTVPHHEQHSNANDAIEAIQTVIGVNPAGGHLTVKDRIIAAETDIANQSVLNGLTDVTIGTANGGDILRYSGTEWVNYPEENLVDGGNF
jgi:hypothetical protein